MSLQMSKISDQKYNEQGRFQENGQHTSKKEVIASHSYFFKTITAALYADHCRGNRFSQVQTNKV